MAVDGQTLEPDGGIRSRFNIGDEVLVLRWLLAGTRAGPFRIVDIAADGRHTVSFGSQASYAADVMENGLVLWSAEIEEQLPSLKRAWRAQHTEADAALVRALRTLEAITK
ncbi:MAG TPA: hypothetical protein VF013_03345 [Candidatus Limnocylindria bacterium]